MFLHKAKTKLDLKVEDNARDRCHRVGSASTHDKRQVKFISYKHMQQVIKNRRKLKRIGIVMKENLTNANSCLLDHICRLVRMPVFLYRV